VPIRPAASTRRRLRGKRWIGTRTNEVLMMRVSILAAMTAAPLLALPAAARADGPTCDQRLATLQFQGFTIPTKAETERFDASLGHAREDRARGDERSCQADLDEAEKLLPKPK
jgi:hypothetical protein